jgi:ankyrin repeat protein
VGVHGGLTALLLASREGRGDTVAALLDAGAGIDQPSAGDRTSPLLMATINGHFDLARTLLTRGASVTLASDAGATPLYGVINMQWAPKARHPQPAHYMQQSVGYLELAEAFLKAGADVNARLTKTLWYTTYNRDLLGVDRTGATAFWLAAYTLDMPAMRLLLRYGADPNIRTAKVPERYEEGGPDPGGIDQSGQPPIPWHGPAVAPIHAASGVGYGLGFAGNTHRHVPEGWVPAVKFLVEELGADVNARDHNGYTPVHHAASRGDNDLIRYLVSKGADVTAVARSGQTTVDMANGPVQRVQPFPDTVELLERLGATNNHRCVSC